MGTNAVAVIDGQILSSESSSTGYGCESFSSSLQCATHSSITPETSESISSPVSSLNALEQESASIFQISTSILEIIFDYALNKFDDCRDRLEAGRPKFISVLNKFVGPQVQIDMCLPAFPFKSANKVYKVFGFLPDKAEEIALARLHDMCKRIEDIYAPGAKVLIISDGLVYNDLLSISDRDTWFYGQALRTMATEKAFTNIRFSSLRDLVDLELPENFDEILYVANATNFRRTILNKFGKDDIDIDKLIADDEDTRLTYQGYRRFLMSDLRHIFKLGENRSSNTYKKETKYLAKQMLVRGYAFAGAIKHNFPDYLRLSIHQSTGEHKVSMSLLNTKTGFTTPWHCSVALMANGEWMSAPMGDFRVNPRMKIAYEKGHPSYFQEMTEEQFLQEKKLAERSIQSEEKSEVKESVGEERNENFFHWKDLVHDVKSGDETKRLLANVDGWLRGGTLTALMGVSGAGKSALLKVLANQPCAGAIHGEILVNGQDRSTASKRLVGIVHQQDLQFATATVKEAVVFSALLRQPKTTPYVEKIAYAEEVIDCIGMVALANTVIGPSGENLSSEQRKRLAIGIELAARPSTFLLLDQPLSGLDSQAALSICALLRRLAKTGLAILCAINQPSARVLQSFDRLILLGKGGKQLYFGKIGPSCKAMINYFERHGARPYNGNDNPAEWILDITSPTIDCSDSKDWSEIWSKSSERETVENKLVHLRERGLKKLESVHDLPALETFAQSSTELSAMDLQQIFNKYRLLESIQLAPSAAGSGICRGQSSSQASILWTVSL